MTGYSRLSLCEGARKQSPLERNKNMSLKTFRTYQLAVGFHRAVKALRLPGYLKINCLEPRAPSPDQRRFYSIALGS